jgi:hypothetical protein
MALHQDGVGAKFEGFGGVRRRAQAGVELMTGTVQPGPRPTTRRKSRDSRPRFEPIGRRAGTDAGGADFFQALGEDRGRRGCKAAR